MNFRVHFLTSIDLFAWDLHISMMEFSSWLFWSVEGVKYELSFLFSTYGKLWVFLLSSLFGWILESLFDNLEFKVPYHSVGFKAEELQKSFLLGNVSRIFVPLQSILVFIHYWEPSFSVPCQNQAEGLCAELNQISCYDFIDQFCGCILDHLSAMQKERYIKLSLSFNLNFEHLQM